MAQKINLSIPKPCHENWQDMTVTEKGRFCGSCQKNVFDFTNASDRQIIEAYNQNNNLCGRFLNTQLDRDLVKPKEKNPIWLTTTSAVLSFLALGTNEAIAQGKPSMVQTDKKDISQNSVIEAVNEEREIKGIVTDTLGPLPGCSIVIKNTPIATYADFEGKFSIKAKKGDILVFSFLGMKEENIQISSSSFYAIKMKEDNRVMLGGPMIYAKRKTFLGRIFYRIGNLFR
ncbi:carboxypeptidase-like regulatory domain-containing protein [Flavobacterium sp.]|uniref:carboxypeptidase-like regulatory domain-containing protein n=1 Tax=Flavobacterium sp. TaxID=239 RepID=UPI003D6A5C4F